MYTGFIYTKTSFFHNDYRFSNITLSCLFLKTNYQKLQPFHCDSREKKIVNQRCKEKQYILIKTLSSTLDAYGF